MAFYTSEVRMPVYTYQCESCGVRFDRYQKFTDQSLTRCPECGKKALRKVYQPVGIVFKGSGFYSTDHKSPSGGIGVPGKMSESEKTDESEKAAESKSESKTEGSAASKAEGSGESKAESKPAEPAKKPAD
jgi:putative FmdB family regulatory protein